MAKRGGKRIGGGAWVLGGCGDLGGKVGGKGVGGGGRGVESRAWGEGRGRRRGGGGGWWGGRWGTGGKE